MLSFGRTTTDGRTRAEEDEDWRPGKPTVVGSCVCLAGQAGARWVATAKTDSASACACRARSCPPGAVFAPVSRDLGGFLRVRGRPMDYSGGAGAGASSTARQLAVVGLLAPWGLGL